MTQTKFLLLRLKILYVYLPVLYILTRKGSNKKTDMRIETINAPSHSFDFSIPQSKL